MKFKTILKNLRKEKNLTQDEFAKAIGFSRTAISAWEIGRNEPSYEDIIKISLFFEVSIDYLLGKTDIRNYEEINKSDVDLTGLDTDDLEKIQEYADLIKFRKNLNEKSS